MPASFISFQVSLESVRCIKDTEKWNDFQVLKNASKAIDENGEPVVTYHGTTAQFTKFEPERSGDIGEDFGKLIFFTDDSRVASGYSIKMSNKVLN